MVKNAYMQLELIDDSEYYLAMAAKIYSRIMVILVGVCTIIWKPSVAFNDVE